MAWPLAGALARFAIAVGGGALLAAPFGIEAQFAAVALGLIAYGVLNAAAVHPAIWR
jgi:hypothetical protein